MSRGLQTVRTRFAFGKAFCSFAIASAAVIFTVFAVFAAVIFFGFLLFPDPALLFLFGRPAPLGLLKNESIANWPSMRRETSALGVDMALVTKVL